MADNQTGLNAQYGAAQFGLDTGPYANSGAPGSQGVSAADSAGGVLANPVVSVSGASSQLPESMPRVAVLAGDSSGMSSDAPVPPGGDPLTGLSLAQVTETGAGQGSAGHFRHPNAGGGA